MEEICLLDSPDASPNRRRETILETGINFWKMNDSEPDYLHLENLMSLLGYKNQTVTFPEFLEKFIFNEDITSIKQSILYLEKNQGNELMIKYSARSRTNEWKKIRSVVKVQERDNSGKIKLMLSQHTDISSLEKIYRVSGKRKNKYLFFQAIFDEAPLGIALISSKYEFKIINPFLCKLLNYSHRELIKLSFDEIVSEEFVVLVRNEVENFFSGNRDAFSREIKLLNKNAQEVWVSINFSQADDFIVKTDCIMITCENISLRKKVEKEKEKIQQNIINAIMMTEEKERKRFAKDLHDGLGPLLSAVKMYIKSLELITDKTKLAEAVNKALAITDEALHTTKEVAVNLSPHVLRDFGLVTALKDQFTKLKAGRDIQLHIQSHFRDKIDEGLEIILFRILEELFNNTLKYADANNVHVSLVQFPKTFRISYTDDGKGFDLKKTKATGNGRGIANIFSRVESLNGSVNMESAPGEGIKVQMKIET